MTTCTPRACVCACACTKAQGDTHGHGSMSAPDACVAWPAHAASRLMPPLGSCCVLAHAASPFMPPFPFVPLPS
eukprot:360793-Chlamydomonas_euryale.AAC.1